MAKYKLNRQNSKSHHKWVILITISAFFISTFMSFFSELLLDNATVFVSFIILIIIIFIGIIADALGVAVTVADEKPFHSMASAKVKSASSSLYLIKHASKVANILCDVIGDVCGIISGTSAALIIVNMQGLYPGKDLALVSLLLSGFIASLTIGGKAAGKEIAMVYFKEIVLFMGKVISVFKTEK
jgi:CBS domain containing-hemolysin-like protein